MSISFLLLLVALSAYQTQGLPMPLDISAKSFLGSEVPTTVRHRFLSLTTGRYVSITRSGRVHANGVINLNNPAKDATPLMIDRLSQLNHLRIASVKYANNGWYLVLTEDETIRAQVPFNDNEILEQVSLSSGFIALRVVNYESIVGLADEGSGSLQDGSDEGGPLMPQSDSDARPECYIGFSHETGRAKCYDNKNNINVRLQMIPHD